MSQGQARSFVQLDDSIVEILASDQLTKADHRLFWHLFLLDRWGDRFVEMPSQSELALQLGIRRETINQSQAKLQSLGLFDFRVSKWKARNLVAPRSNATPEKTHTVLDFSNSELENSHSELENSHSELENSHSELENSHSDIYIDRARDQTVQSNTDLRETIPEEADAPPPSPPPSTEVLEVEIVGEESQPTATSEGDQSTATSFVVSEDGTCSINAIAFGEEQSTPPRDATGRLVKLREIEKLSAMPQNFPWKEADGVSFRAEMIDAVYEANRTWYSLPNGQKNKVAIIARLKTLEKNLRKLDEGAITSWNTLQSYWESAVTFLPEVQQVKQAFEDKEREEARARRKNHRIRFTA
ncbi:hypothetical protein [Scytonema sp. PCC 10023]|uniref:hypothetical protein n=1 Tax=Scytonema sp. PCC 10023 TaxID=1680591 RepID=UPI0039C5CED9